MLPDSTQRDPTADRQGETAWEHGQFRVPRLQSGSLPVSIELVPWCTRGERASSTDGPRPFQSSVLLRQQDDRQIPRCLRDDVLPLSAAALIHRHQTAAVAQGLLVLLPVRCLQEASVAAGVTGDRLEQLLRGQRICRLGRDAEPPEGESGRVRHRTRPSEEPDGWRRKRRGRGIRSGPWDGHLVKSRTVLV